MLHELCLSAVALAFVYLSVARLLYDAFTLSILQLATEDIDMFRCRYVYTSHRKS